MSKFNISLILLTFITYSCSSVQDAVFPSLSDEEVVAPPALEEVPAAVEDLAVTQNTQEIPPSQYAPLYLSLKLLILVPQAHSLEGK